MGSGSSRPRPNPSGSRPSRPINRSPSRILSSMICGGSSSAASSRAAAEMEDRPYEMLMSSVQHCEPLSSKFELPVQESSTVIDSEVVPTNSDGVIGRSSTGSIASSKRQDGDSGLVNTGSTNRERRFSESLEFVSSRVSGESTLNDSFRNRYSGEASSTSFREQQSSSRLSVNNSANEDLVNGVDHPETRDVRQTLSRTIFPESSFQRIHASPIGRAFAGNYMDEMAPWPLHDSDSSGRSFELRPVSNSLGDESVQEATPEGLGLLVSEQAPEDDDMLHVDVVSISSSFFSRNNADTAAQEGRRTSRRLFWDAFSRRSSWRPIDPPPTVLSTDSTDDFASRDRWLLDFSGDFLSDGVSSDAGYLGGRIRSWNDRRRQSRSEIWERLIGSLDENDRRTTLCPSGLHPDGTCSCESLLTNGESSTRASISRIVMLAEALFEVLDEIHRQPSSLSLSTVSLPAPESVVDSFPLKNHKKVDSVEVEQCYICLAEYEEGDKIRVLPCHHEYHMSCVDKWLKEIHGVCPLCRGDVRQGSSELLPPTTSEIPSLE